MKVADRQSGLIISFLLQWQVCYGELCGLRMAATVTGLPPEVFAKSRLGIISMMKALWHAFGKVVRSELSKEPEELLDWCSLFFILLAQLQPEMDRVPPHAEVLAKFEKEYQSHLAGAGTLQGAPLIH